MPAQASSSSLRGVLAHGNVIDSIIMYAEINKTQYSSLFSIAFFEGRLSDWRDGTCSHVEICAYALLYAIFAINIAAPIIIVYTNTITL